MNNENNEMDARIPGAFTAWQLWHTDTFDRESLLSLQGSGENIFRVKLRQGAHLMAQDQEQNPGTPEHLQERRNSVLSRLAQLHYALLQRSNRWTATAVDWSAEARKLLAHVEEMTDSEEL